MATKLKRYNVLLKTMAFIIIITLTMTGIYRVFQFEKSFSENKGYSFTLRDLAMNEFSKTGKFYSEVHSIQNHFDIITSENDYTEALSQVKENLFNENYENIIDKYYNFHFKEAELMAFFETQYADAISEMETELISAISEFFTNSNIEEIKNTDDFKNELNTKKNALYINVYEVLKKQHYSEKTETFEREDLFKFYELNYSKEIAELEEKNKENYNNYYNESLNSIKNNPNIVYYARNQNTDYKNSNYKDSDIHKLFTYNYGGEDYNYGFAFTPEYIDLIESEFEKTVKIVNEFVINAVIFILIYLVCLSYLVFSAGRRNSEKVIYLLPFDRIFNEITLAIMIISVYLALYSLHYLLDIIGSGTILEYLLHLSLLLMILFFYICFFILIRHLKNRTFIKNSIIYKLLNFIFRGFKNIGGILKTVYSKKNPMFKTVFIITVLGIFTMIPFAGIITIPFSIWFIRRRVKSYQKLYDGVETIRDGVFSEKIIINDNSEFAKLGSNINEIASGLSHEVRRRTKSERLKSELIVNVSHDIRTPLTSLITYTDLLKKEETDNENINKYTDIIMQKAHRLKTLIDDLFESVKAASGNITVNLEKVDINALILQVFGEMDDKIQSTTLDFITTVPETKIYALADGNLLWRIVQNLISNVLNYSMEYSRVYINVFSENEEVIIEIKNISKIPLNIPADEITERFKRGDESRNSQGSGLGLDIAKSLAQCQDGRLDIKIDGDLFKVEVRVKKFSEE